MPTMKVTNYTNKNPQDVPRLFSATREFEFLTRRGELVHRVLPTGPLGYKVISVATTGHYIEVDETDRITLSMPFHGSADVTLKKRTLSLRPGTAVAFGPNTRRSKLMPAGEGLKYQSVTVFAPPSVTQKFPAPEGWVLRHASNDVADLSDVIRFATSMADRRAAMAESTAAHLERLVEEAFWRILTPDPDHTPFPRIANGSERLVRRTMDYIRDHYSHPMSVQSIADAMGVSPRTLQYAFARNCGTSPRQFLSEVRIDELHKQLLGASATTTVTTATMSVGLVHTGRASKAYRARFGESPSQTLKRARTAGR